MSRISATAIPEPTHSTVDLVVIAALATAGYAITPSCRSACGAARIDQVEATKNAAHAHSRVDQHHHRAHFEECKRERNEFAER